MAGFVSTVSQWAEFSRKWEQAINEAGIPCFHMADFVARVRPFDKLTDLQREQLMRRLVMLINQYALASFDMAVLQSDFDEMLSEYKDTIRSSWTYLTMMSINGVMFWSRMQSHLEPIHFIFDRGDRYSNEFNAAFAHWLAKKPTFSKEMLLGDFVLADRCAQIPLQAADMFAWEVLKYRANKLTNPATAMRGSLKQLLKTPLFSIFANRKWLARCAAKFSMPIRFE
jgi:hypothetical protein